MSNDYLFKDAKALLAMADGNEKVAAYYAALPLGSIWHNNEGIKRSIIGTAGSFDDAISRMTRALYMHSPSHVNSIRAVNWHRRHEYAHNIPDARESAATDAAVIIDGKHYWHDDFRHWATVKRMRKMLQHRAPDIVVELGAGCGHLIRLMKGMWPAARFIIIDLPDTLVFSMMFLRWQFPDATWSWINGPDDDFETDFTFMPVGMETDYDTLRADLFVNTASLGEMKQATVQHWINFAAKTCGMFFSVNRFLNAVTPQEFNWRHDENAHALMIGPEWRVADWELGPDFLRCPWQNRHARQLLMGLVKRITPETLEPSHEEAIIAALSGSWNQLGRVESMTSHDPPLHCDFTMNGPLFALWNAWRISRSPQSKAALLSYMAYLRGNSPRQFEDELHLEAR